MRFRAERLLARMFFGRFFESDVATGVPAAQLVIWAIAGLAMPGFMMALWLGRSYQRLVLYGLGDVMAAALRDQLLYVAFSMMALAFVALIVWESVFPDRRDVRVLDVLPLATSAHVVGRLAALGAFAALFAVGINVPSTVAYPIVLRIYSVGDWVVRIAPAHLIATACAGAFGFFFVILVQGVILNIFGRNLARRLALVLQGLFAVVLLQGLLLTPHLASIAGDALHRDRAPLLAFLPPVSFLALYDLLAGTHRPAPPAAALAAVAATIAAMALAAALVAASYRRLVRIAIETPDRGRAAGRLVHQLTGAFARLVTRAPIERAIAGFGVRSLVRSRTHLTLFATYGGIGAALATAFMVPALLDGSLLSRTRPSLALLAAPLIVNFFALCGFRVLVGIPTVITANWVFRIHAPDDRIVALMNGARLIALCGVVLPTAILCGAAGGALWGPERGLVFLAFTAGTGWLLADLLLLGLRKIPFACTYFPGSSRAQTLWPIYLGGLAIYAYLLANLELRVMQLPGLRPMVFSLLAAALAVVALVRRRLLQTPPGVTYVEEEPDRMFSGFGLSEGFAAETPARDGDGAVRGAPIAGLLIRDRTE